MKTEKTLEIIRSLLRDVEANQKDQATRSKWLDDGWYCVLVTLVPLPNDMGLVTTIAGGDLDDLGYTDANTASTNVFQHYDEAVEHYEATDL